MTPEEIVAKTTATAPELTLIWTAVVDIAPLQDLGAVPGGHRYMVPILGGRFFAGPGGAGLTGTVLPGGADRQFVDETGFKMLDALYEMQTDDGQILTIRNEVKVDASDPDNIYRRSVIGVNAPRGRFEWLNRRLFVGTLDPARPDREAVIIRAWG